MIKRFLICFFFILFFAEYVIAQPFWATPNPPDKMDLKLNTNISIGSEYDIDTLNSFGRIATEVGTSGMAIINTILPESLLLKSIELYLIMGHTKGVLTTLYNRGKFRVHAMAGMNNPIYRLPLGSINKYRAPILKLFHIDLKDYQVRKANPIIPYTFGFGIGLWWPSYQLEATQTESAWQQYTQSDFYQYNNQIQAFVLADAFNREQYFAESMSSKFEQGQAHFLDSVPFLMAQLNMFNWFDFNGALSNNPDVNKYINALSKLGIKTNRTLLRKNQLIKVFGYSTLISAGLLADFILNREKRISKFFRLFGIWYLKDWTIHWWPEFYTYMTILGPTLKTVVSLHNSLNNFRFGYETNAFFQHGANIRHEFSCSWTNNLKSISDYLAPFSYRFYISSNGQTGIWMENQIMFKVLSIFTVGIQHYWGYGESFTRFVKGNDFSFHDKWENGFKFFASIQLNF